MTDPIKKTREALAEMDKLLGELGTLRSYLSIMAATETPKGYTPLLIEAQAPFFQETTYKGREALRATVVIEITCIKEDIQDEQPREGADREADSGGN